jgi:hypothetical protein
MMPVLESIYSGSIQKDKEFLISLFNNNDQVNINKRIKNNFLYNFKNKINMLITILYFYAYYNDNKDLLKLLLSENIIFNTKCKSDSNLFILDKRLSKCFTNEKYLHLIRNNISLLREIYFSHNEEIYAKLMDINPNLECYVSENRYCDTILSNMCVEKLGYKYVANSNELQQRCILQAASDKFETLRLILEINPNFIAKSSDIFNFEFISEIGGFNVIAYSNLDQQQSYLIAYKSGKVDELKQVLAINPNFLLYINYGYTVLDSQVIGDCGFDNIAWFTQSIQNKICDKLDDYERSKVHKEHFILNRYKYKDVIAEAKKLVKSRNKN